jgi:hypothetical protein
MPTAGDNTVYNSGYVTHDVGLPLTHGEAVSARPQILPV